MNTEEKTVSQAVDVITATVAQLGETVNEFGLEKETASSILERFTPLFANANDWKIKAEALVAKFKSFKTWAKIQIDNL